MTIILLWAMCAVAVSSALLIWAFQDAAFSVTRDICLDDLRHRHRTPPIPDSLRNHYRTRIRLFWCLAGTFVVIGTIGFILIWYYVRSAESMAVITIGSTLLVVILSPTLTVPINRLGRLSRHRRLIRRLRPLSDRILVDWPTEPAEVSTERDGTIDVRPIGGYDENVLVLEFNDQSVRPFVGPVVVRVEDKESRAIAFYVEEEWWLVLLLGGTIPATLEYVHHRYLANESRRLDNGWYSVRYALK